MSTSPIDPRGDDADGHRREDDGAVVEREGHRPSTMNHAHEVHGVDVAPEGDVSVRTRSGAAGSAAGDGVDDDGAPTGWWPFGPRGTTDHPEDDADGSGDAAHAEYDTEGTAHPGPGSPERTVHAEDGAHPVTEGDHPAPGGRHHAVGREVADPGSDDVAADDLRAEGEAAAQDGVGTDAKAAGSTHGGEADMGARSGDAADHRAESDGARAAAEGPHSDDKESGVEGTIGAGDDAGSGDAGAIGVVTSDASEGEPEGAPDAQERAASDGQDDANPQDQAGSPSSDGPLGREDAADEPPEARAAPEMADGNGQADVDAQARATATEHVPTGEAPPSPGEPGHSAGTRGEGPFHVEHEAETAGMEHDAADRPPRAFHVEHGPGADDGNGDGLPTPPPPFHVQHEEHGHARPGSEDSAADAASQPVPPPPLRRPRFEAARIMAVANQKGGVGKTTTAVSLAAAVAETGAQVLLVDLDPQGNASSGLGMRPKEGQATIYHVLVEGLDILDAVEPANVRNLFVVPTNIDLAGAEVELVSMFSREQRLRRALESVVEEFDLIIIDCPPSLGLLTVNALTAADGVIVPIQCEYYALEGLGALRRNADLVRSNLNPELEITGFVLTMLDARTRLSQMVVDEVKAHFGDRVFRTRIPRSVRLAEAPSFGQPITVFDPGSRGAMAYRRLAGELLERLGAQ